VLSNPWKTNLTKSSETRNSTEGVSNIRKAYIQETQSLGDALGRFSTACDQAGMKISTKKTEVFWLTRNPRQCMLQVSGNTLQQVEKFNHLVVVFMSDVSRNQEIDTRIGEANPVLRKLYRSVVTKRELSKTAELFSKSVFVQILAYGHQARNQLVTPGGGREVFWEGPKVFKLIPILLNYVQRIFPGGRKIF